MDATALTSRLAMWEEHDKAIKDGYERFNNEIIKKYAADKDMRIGYWLKNNKKFWFGYKKHVAVDAQSGMITRLLVLEPELIG